MEALYDSAYTLKRKRAYVEIYHIVIDNTSGTIGDYRPYVLLYDYLRVCGRTVSGFVYGLDTDAEGIHNESLITGKELNSLFSTFTKLSSLDEYLETQTMHPIRFVWSGKGGIDARLNPAVCIVGDIACDTAGDTAGDIGNCKWSMISPAWYEESIHPPAIIPTDPDRSGAILHMRPVWYEESIHPPATMLGYEAQPKRKHSGAMLQTQKKKILIVESTPYNDYTAVKNIHSLLQHGFNVVYRRNPRHQPDPLNLVWETIFQEYNVYGPPTEWNVDDLNVTEEWLDVDEMIKNCDVYCSQMGHGSAIAGVLGCKPQLRWPDKTGAADKPYYHRFLSHHGVSLPRENTEAWLRDFATQRWVEFAVTLANDTAVAEKCKNLQKRFLDTDISYPQRYKNFSAGCERLCQFAMPRR